MQPPLLTFILPAPNVHRFYDPVGGGVFLDGHNIQDLNLRWLRQQIALVQQEPVLFSCTIYENVGFTSPCIQRNFQITDYYWYRFAMD